MNKQAFTFLTLFTLVLLLSVYYVTLPSDSSTISPDSLISSVEQDIIEEYTQEKRKQSDELIRKNEQVISSSSSTSEEKLEALKDNAELNVKEQIELEIEELLKEHGYDMCFVEKNEQVIRVVLPLEYESQQTAVQVMKWIGSICFEDELIEVSFE